MRILPQEKSSTTLPAKSVDFARRTINSLACAAPTACRLVFMHPVNRLRSHCKYPAQSCHSYLEIVRHNQSSNEGDRYA